MGLVAYDVSLDTYCHSSGSSSLSRFANRPAIHLVIPDVELIKQQFALFQGSGGKLMPHNSNIQSGGNVAVNIPAPDKTLSALKEISTFFGLTKLELAQILQLQSTKSLYNLLNGKTETRKSTIDRVFDLLIVTRALKGSGLNTISEFIRQPILNRLSMLDLLKEKVIDQERIVFAASRLQLMTQPVKSLSDPFA